MAAASRRHDHLDLRGADLGRSAASDAFARYPAQCGRTDVRQGTPGVTRLRRRGFEATLVALFYAVVAWIVMHVAIMIASDNHPNYYDPVVIIGGFTSHFFFTVPLALIVKRRLAPRN